MIKVVIRNIQYDVDAGPDKKSIVKALPKKLEKELDYDYASVMEDKRNGSSLDDIEDAISEHISDTTGYCHTGFTYTIKRA